MMAVVEGGGAEAFTFEQWTNFFAHLHPLLLHMPIGLLFASVLLELVTLFSKQSAPARRWVNTAFAFTAILAGLSGWVLGGGDDYGSALVDEHRKFGIAASVAAVLVGLSDMVGRGGRMTFFRRVALLAAMGLITAAGHRGGMLTHGKSFLSEHAPSWLAPYVGVVRERRPAPSPPNRMSGATPPQNAVASDGADGVADAESPERTDTQGEAEPPEVEHSATVEAATGAPLAEVVAVFRDRCFECHNEFKTKGSLRFDELSGWVDTVDPSDVEFSELLYRLLLPADDGDAMPPKGDRLDPAIIQSIREWIESGAPTDELETLLSGAALEREASVASLDEVRASTAASILAEVGAAGQDRAPPLVVSWSHTPDAPTPARVAALAPIADRIVELAWAGTDAGDDEVEALPTLPLLRRAHLERTPLSDRGVTALLQRAPNLVYLNVHSTDVSAAIRSQLEQVPSLQEVVLFGTAAASDVPADPFARVGVAQPRRLLVMSSDGTKVALLREMAIGKPELLWERAFESAASAAWGGVTERGHGRVLVQESPQRVVEIDTGTDEVVWAYDTPPVDSAEGRITSFRRLADGTTLIAEASGTRLVFVDNKGEVVAALPRELLEEPALPQIQELTSGNLVLTNPGAGEDAPFAVEVTPGGEQVWSFRDAERFPSGIRSLRVIERSADR